tara:strand:+ start:2140 stop:2577 length:438 start_codon:yes stop_codon:yes gene_type:complete
MEYSLTMNQEIALIIFDKIPIPDLCIFIIDQKCKKEEKDTYNYHYERWETIASKYFKSFEYDRDKRRIPYSYVLDSKIYNAYRDKCLDYYYETGVSYQVRDLLMDIINCPNDDHSIINKDNDEWRKSDDEVYSILAKKIMDMFKN